MELLFREVLTFGWCSMGIGRFSLYLIILIEGVLVASSTVYGIFRGFSSVPFMDMWDGYLGFYKRVESGGYLAWITQHNEHRIFFSRILFWLDIKLFGGLSIFLVSVNVALQAAIAWILLRINNKHAKNRISILVFIGLEGVLLFSWMQIDNLIQGFQSQFLFVFVFALLAFYFMSKVKDEFHNSSELLGAICFSAFATLSMGNGLLVFLVLIFQSILLRLDWRKVALLVGVLGAVALLYFWGYSRPVYHASPLDGLRYHLKDILEFVFIFYGGPVYLIFGNFFWAAIVGGGILTVSVLLLAIMYWRRQVTQYRSVLFGLIIFIIISSFGIASSRYNFGMEMAVSSRYMTPVLLGWLSLLLLIFDIVGESAYLAMMMFLAFGILPVLGFYQKHLFDDIPQRFYEKVALVSLKLGINDEKYMVWLLPLEMHKDLINLSKYADDEKLSIYSSKWLSDIGNLKFEESLVNNSWCAGSFEKIEKISRGYFLTGWAAEIGVSNKSMTIVFVDGANSVVGYGVTGEIRPDVASYKSDLGSHTGWRGYLYNIKINPPVVAYAHRDGSFCRLASLF